MTTETTTEFETVIGLEVHCQLRTRSKMFCRCPADYSGSEPNTEVCPLCLGMPGTLPVINRTAVEWTIRTALALNMTIPELSKFDRKNYPYPDLMKGYQISQYDMPLSEGGWMDVETEDLGKRRIGITRVHLEEDTARLLHRENEVGERYSLVDVNRSGVPLMEIVSEPDMRSPDEARTYLVKLRQILRYLGVSTADMEKGSFRCDANVSLRPVGTTELGAKVEIKNMNSFRGVHSALEHEVERQAEVLRSGGTIDQETRGWDEDRQITLSQRSKEEAHDYRYFPEPDLPPLSISREEVESLRSQLPELPEQRRARFQSDYGLGDFEAHLLTEEPSRADYFDETIAALSDAANAKEAANWITGDLFAQINKDPSHPDLEDQPIRPAHVAELVGLIVGGDISRSQARTVFESMYESGDAPAKIVKAKGLTQISGEDALSPIINQVIGDNPDAVNDYRSGKEAALKFLVGQVMRHSRGQANPAQASELLVSALSE
ncbi:MAG: Asp-tRNA(Asn)/Glu-tRNA(Gln) amidotransferase subunit GatB [Chloroflexi bacterium]|nr:Asp-tRNA(Asn)/Glu-tRNA(Gln) amidotransferase subunit GatB [Chloroflexota bacterium]